MDDDVADDRLNMLLVLRKSPPPFDSSTLPDPSVRSNDDSVLFSCAHCEEDRDHASSPDSLERECRLRECDEVTVLGRGRDLDLDPLLSSLFTRL